MRSKNRTAAGAGHTDDGKAGKAFCGTIPAFNDTTATACWQGW